MKTIYIITSGQYSDYYVHGYAETEKDAINICRKHNTTMHNNFDTWEYEEKELLEKPERDINIRYVYKFYLEYKNGMLHYSNNYTRYEYDEEDKEHSTITLDSKPDYSGINNFYLYIPVKRGKEDIHVIKKIAQDFIARYNYEQTMQEV